VKQVEFGPRAPGSEGHQRAHKYFIEIFQEYADKLGQQNFTYKDKNDSTLMYNGVNIIASFNLKPKVKKRIMLAAHWDTRPFADQESDISKRNIPVPGANDGASGVAVLLEMARVLHSNPPDIGVDIILFDLEDLGDNHEGKNSNEGKTPFAIGSEYFAEHYSHYRPTFGILLDMVGDKNLRIPKEGNSLTYAADIIDKVWAAAEKVDATVFKNEIGSAVMDDHVAFIKRGIRVINLIHNPFPSYWHTLEDTPDKCSAQSLQQVGNVLIEVIYNE